MQSFVRAIFILTIAAFSAPAYASEPEATANTPADSSSMTQAADSVQFTFSEPRPRQVKWYTMFERIPGDWVTFANLNFREEKIPAMLAMTALTAAAIATDQPVWEVSDRWYKSSRTVKDISDVFVYIGDGKPQFGLAAAFGVYGFWKEDDRALRTASQLVETILACGTVIQILKHITGRESPFVSTRTNGRWVFFPDQVEYHKHVPHYDAFPSGHIATATATLVVVMENYPEWKPWLKPLSYFIIAGIGVGLSNTGIHWWSDYPLGIALGYQFGMIAAHPEGLDVVKSEKQNTPKLSVAPEVSPVRRGVKLTLSF